MAVKENVLLSLLLKTDFSLKCFFGLKSLLHHLLVSEILCLEEFSEN